MYEMHTDERRRFLSHGTRTAMLATVRADGRPHVAPVWFVLDGDDVVFLTGAGTVKGRNLARTAYASVSVDDDEPPFSFVMIEEPISLDTDLQRLYQWALPISERYMGVQRAEEYARRNAVEGELLVRLRPAHIVAQAALAD